MPFRRVLPTLSVGAALALAACGSDDGAAGSGGAAGVDAGGAAGVDAGGAAGAAAGGASGGSSGGGGLGAAGSGGAAGAASGGAGSGGTAAGGAGGSTGSGGTASGGTGGGAGSSLRLFGFGKNDVDRVKIRIDDETNALPGPPADIGATDFSVEFWMRASASDNTSGSIACSGYAWINGNIIVDRDRFNQGRAFGISVAAGRVVFGVINANSSSNTICSTTNVLDQAWHHVAVQRRRSDGRLWIFIDGKNEAEQDGPDGDISYPDNGVPGNHCGGPCNFSDPFLVIGAEKHDAGTAYPSYSGHFDELRLSNTLRYSADFTRPSGAFSADANTVGLYHFDEGSGTVAGDSSGASGGPSPGLLKVGGTPVGPIWSSATPF